MSISLTPSLCRMARAGLKLSQKDLSKMAKVATATLADFERGSRIPGDRILRDIQSELENAGALFLEEDTFGPGLRVPSANR